MANEKNKYWWMSPDLKFYELGSMMYHYRWAEQYLKDAGKYTGDTDVYSTMYNLGWIRVCKIWYQGKFILSYNYSHDHRPTPKQIKELKDWAIENECSSIRDDTNGEHQDLLQENINELNKNDYGGWLGPDNKFHEVKNEKHREWAEQYLDKIGRKDYVNAYTELYNLGFIRLLFWEDVLHYCYGDKLPTQKQIKEIKDLAIELKMSWIHNANTHKTQDLLQENDEDDEDLYGGWLSPDLKLYSVNHEGHDAWAHNYLKEKNIPFTYKDSIYNIMYKLGWIRIFFGGSTLWYNAGMMREFPRPTPKQMKELRDLAIEHGCVKLVDSDTGQQKDVDELLQEAVNKQKTLYVGFVLPEENFKVIAYDAYDVQGHFEIKQKHPELQSIKNKVPWRYRKDLNTIFWWGYIPNDDIKDSVNWWIYKNIGKKNPKNKELNIEIDDKYLSAHNVDENMYPKDFDRNAIGSCMSAAEMSTKYFLKKNIKDFEIVEGWVAFGEENKDWKLYWKNKKLIEYGDVFSHTWIKFKNGRIFDPTKKQWEKWGFNPSDGKIVKVKTTYKPEEYLEMCEWDPSPWTNFVKQLGESTKPLNKKTLGSVITEEILKELYDSMEENMTYEDLLKLTTDDRKKRAVNVNVRSLPVSMDENMESWNFRYKSTPQTTITDKPFKGKITFLKGEVGPDDDAQKLECKVDCECPDFMYRFAYNDTAKGASNVGNDSLSGCINRRPKPAYDFGEGLCKHLIALGKYLKTKIEATKKSNLFEAVDEVSKQGPFNIEYYD